MITIRTAILVLCAGLGLISPQLSAQQSSTADTAKRDCTRGELRVSGRIKEVSVAPDGRVWLTTAIGNSYVADSIDGDWRYGSLRRMDTTRLSGHPHIDRISFFDNDTAIATGYILTPSMEAAYVYRTVNRGASWDSVVIGSSDWIYNVYVGAKGQAWMGGSSGSLRYTNDYGRTWKVVSVPFDGSSRLHAIFMTPSGYGLVGALEDHLKVTKDGGITWMEIATPRQQLKSERKRDARIEKVGVIGDFIVIQQQGEGVFYSRRDSIHWSPIPGPILSTFALNENHGPLVGVTDSLYVVTVDSTLKSRKLSTRRLEAEPLHLTVNNGTVYILDREYGLSTVSPSGFKYSLPLTSAYRTTEMDIQRLRYGKIWGITRNHIYDTYDNGVTWCRIGSVPFTISGAEILSPNEIMLWDGHGYNARFNKVTGVTERVADFSGDDVVGVVRTEGVWLAFGGMQYETTGRVDVSRSFFSGQFRGTRPYGFVYLSSDSGKTWRQIDRWKESGVLGASVMPGGDIMLISYLGSLRHLKRTNSGYVPQSLLVATPDNREEVPYVQELSALYFSDDTTGYVAGWIHQLGSKFYKTIDKGLHWVPIHYSEFPYSQIISVPEGHIAAAHYKLYMLNGPKKRLLSLPGTALLENQYIGDISAGGPGKVLVKIIDAKEDGSATNRWITVTY